MVTQFGWKNFRNNFSSQMATDETQIVQRNAAKQPKHWERLLLESLNCGVSEPMTAVRKKRIYQQALAGSQLFGRLLRRPF